MSPVNDLAKEYAESKWTGDDLGMHRIRHAADDWQAGYQAALSAQEPTEHPLSGLHINAGSLASAADAYEADYWADQMQRKADADALKGALQPVAYYVRDAINRIQAAQEPSARAALQETK